MNKNKKHVLLMWNYMENDKFIVPQLKPNDFSEFKSNFNRCILWVKISSKRI